jgi:hypothetical protein
MDEGGGGPSYQLAFKQNGEEVKKQSSMGSWEHPKEI